jgi:hypothetical protein
MNSITGITKFCVSHKRTDAKKGKIFSAFIWAQDYMHAWEKAKELEKKIELVYDITIDGVFLGEIEYNINLDTNLIINKDPNYSVIPWFIYYQLDELETIGESIDYDSLINYFEQFEEYEICTALVLKKKQTCTYSIKL